MLNILADSLMIATFMDGDRRKLDHDRHRAAADQYFWWGRRWRHPEDDRGNRPARK